MAMTANQLLELRTIIPDDAPIFGASADEYMLSDEALNAIFDGSGRSSVLRTAGFACRAIGNSELLIGKSIRNDEITTDGARTAAEWRQAAKQFFDEAEIEFALENESFELIDSSWCTPELAPRVVHPWL